MCNARRVVLLACIGLLAPCAQATEPPEAPPAYDSLPDGTPSEVAGLFFSAVDVPDLAEWPVEDTKALLDVVTLRYKNRLIDRAPAASPQRVQRYVERLAQSALVREFPNALRQTCAQYGLATGSCAKHRGYVRRAQVLEEMLVQGQLTLDRLETELAGAPRPRLAAWRQAIRADE